MYIKIKHIKHFLIIFACISLASWNYFAYAQTADATQKQCNKTIDSDCDGLTNSEEALYETNPNNPDTDGDGYSDGVEVASGYDPTKSAPNDKILHTSNLETKNLSEVTSNNGSFTENFSNSIDSYIKTNAAGKITREDLTNFVNAEIDKEVSNSSDFNSLPEIDISSIKTINQDYTELTIAEKKQRKVDDANRYFEQVIYILLGNSPRNIASKSDFMAMRDELIKNIQDLSSQNSDLAYFNDMGNRLETILGQLNNITVPATIMPLHTKFIKLGKGLLEFRNFTIKNNDPLGRIVLMKRINNFTKLYSDFFVNDFKDYLTELKK